MARREPLGVWLYGCRIGEIESRRPGEVRFRYSEEALERWPSNTPLLSCSLPLGRRPLDARNYFRGLLPEGLHLQALADEARVPTYDTFGLLDRFGRDVAGAIVVSSGEPGERPGGLVPYATDGLDAEVAGLDDRPLAIYDDSELSIPGLQNKLLLVATADGWARPVGGRPSTHILKVEDRRYPGLVTMEAACLGLARDVGLTTVDVEVRQFGGQDCLIVSRFDRRETRAGPERLHQEDTCQALDRDIDAQQRRGKYESAGGPSLGEVAGLLDAHSDRPIPELVQLAKAMTFTVVTGNSDAHGKNISLLHREPGVVALAPLYDTVPTVLWDRLPDRAAMTVNGRTCLGDVTRADVVAEARSWNLDPAIASEAVEAICEGLLIGLSERETPAELAALVTDRARRLLADRPQG